MGRGMPGQPSSSLDKKKTIVSGKMSMILELKLDSSQPDLTVGRLLELCSHFFFLFASILISLSVPFLGFNF